MQLRRWFFTTGCPVALGLLLVSCAPGATPTPLAKEAPSKIGATPATSPSPLGPSPTAKPAGEQPRYGGVLTTDNMTDPPHFDLHQLSGASQRRCLRPTYHELVEWDPYPPNSAVVGGVAESWQSSPDGRTWTFRLKKGVRFHDGSAATSEDVKFTLDRMRDPPKGVFSARKGNLQAIDKIETPDAETVKITLRYPQGSFLAILTASEITVYSASALKAGKDPKKDVIGIGPFNFKRYTQGISFELTKNQDYFVKERPYLDGITFYLIRDVSTRFAAFRTGQVMLTSVGSGGLTPAQAERTRREMQGQAEAVRYPGLNFHTLHFNMTKVPWNDVRVRKAVDLAVDRQGGISSIQQGSATLGAYLVAGSEWALPQEKLATMPGFRQPKDADRAEAKRLLAEAGFPNGFEVSLSYGTRDQHVQLAEFFAAQLATIGIKAKSAPEEYSLYLSSLSDHKFIIGVESTSSYVNDPDEIFGQRYVTGAPRNYMLYSDKSFDELFEKQSATVDVTERKKIVSRMEQMLFDAIPSAILYWTNCDLGIWKQVKNYYPGWGWFVGVRFTDVWLAK